VAARIAACSLAVSSSVVAREAPADRP